MNMLELQGHAFTSLQHVAQLDAVAPDIGSTKNETPSLYCQLMNAGALEYSPLWNRNRTEFDQILQDVFAPLVPNVNFGLHRDAAELANMIYRTYPTRLLSESKPIVYKPKSLSATLEKIGDYTVSKLRLLKPSPCLLIRPKDLKTTVIIPRNTISQLIGNISILSLPMELLKLGNTTYSSSIPTGRLIGTSYYTVSPIDKDGLRIYRHTSMHALWDNKKFVRTIVNKSYNARELANTKTLLAKLFPVQG